MRKGVFEYTVGSDHYVDVYEVDETLPLDEVRAYLLSELEMVMPVYSVSFLMWCGHQDSVGGVKLPPNQEMEVQTRDNYGGLCFFSSVDQAFDHADQNPDVWKVSFQAKDGTRCRFVKHASKGDANWCFDPIIIDDVVEEPEEDAIKLGQEAMTRARMMIQK